MSTKLRERQENIQQVLQRLTEESARGTIIVVEGKKDVKTLRTLGVEGPIITAKTGGKSRLDLISEIEKAEAKEVILLMDFDRRGREWTAYLLQALEKAKIQSNIMFRKELLRFAGRDLKDVEGLAAYLETMNKKLNGA